MKTGALIVAAGLSSRMGSFKPMLRLGEDTAIRRIIKTLMEAGADPVVVITGHKAEKLERHLSDLPVICLKNENYENTQMLDSAKIGLEFLSGKCDALLFTPADVPLFSLKTIKDLLACGHSLACPCDGGMDGHPLLIGAGLIPSLLSFRGEGGLRGAVLACGAELTRIQSDDRGAFLDADTPEEFSKLERLAKTRTRLIYLIRHGQPRFPEGVPLCLGSRDLPLSGRGISEAMALRDFFKGKSLSVYSSPLRRCVETAAIISRDIKICSGLREISLGDWEGHTFEEIKNLWPELYRLRGDDPLNQAPPNGESFKQCAERANAVLTEILRSSPGDVLISAHSGVGRALLSLYSDDKNPLNIKQPYGGVSLLVEEGGSIRMNRAGEMPPPLKTAAVPDRETCFKLLKESGVPDHVVRHCAAVADAALELTYELVLCGLTLDPCLTEAAALLHDIARLKPNHAEAGAALLTQLGYPALAPVVAAHMQLPEEDGISEKSLVYLADKLVCEDRRVTLEERFSRHFEDVAHKEVASLRYDRAKRLCLDIERVTGKPVVQA